MAPRLKRSLILVILLVIFAAGVRGAPGSPPPKAGGPEAPAGSPAANISSYIKRSSSAAAVTADGRLLLVVNPDSGSLSLVETGAPHAVTEIPVGADPRTVAVNDDGTRAYTANRGENTVSVIHLDTRQVIGEIPVGPRPYGVVVSPDGGALYVTEQGSDRLTVIDTATLAQRVSLPLPDRPSGLAISDDGQTLYVTHLLGREITVLKLPITRVYLPLVSRTGQVGAGELKTRPAAGESRPSTASSLRLASAQETAFADSEGGFSIVESGEGSLFAAPHEGAQATSITLFPASNLIQSIVIAPGGEEAYVPHTLSNSGNPALTLDTTIAPLVSVIDLVSGQHLVGEQFSLAILDPPAVGLPFDAALTPDGRELWVLNAASNDLTVIDLQTRQRLAHIEVGDNPRGVAIHPDGGTAYVNNTLAGTVSLIDTWTYSVTATIQVTDIPLDLALLTGKRLFHTSDDPRMGQDQWMSCNTCHFDGEHDGRTWLLGFAGPRNTTGLLGMGATLPLRWSGEWDEAADAEFAIRMDSFGSGLVDGEMNCTLDPPDCAGPPPHAGLSADLDALAAYISALEIPLSPGHVDGQPLSDAEQRGMALFTDPAVGCAACHPPPLYTDNLSHDVGTATEDELIGPAFNTPSLRGLYDSAPYFHDGSADTLGETLVFPSPGGEHDVSGVLSAGEIEDLVAFLLALPFNEQGIE